LEKLGAVATLAAEIECLSGHVHVRFPGQQAEPLLIRLDRLGIAAGSGAACSSGSLEPSHVMQAAGYTEAESREGLRFTLGPETNAEEIDLALARIAQARAVPSQD
jgi:cysteine desulfurase